MVGLYRIINNIICDKIPFEQNIKCNITYDLNDNL